MKKLTFYLGRYLHIKNSRLLFRLIDRYVYLAHLFVIFNRLHDIFVAYWHHHFLSAMSRARASWNLNFLSSFLSLGSKSWQTNEFNHLCNLILADYSFVVQNSKRIPWSSNCRKILIKYNSTRILWSNSRILIKIPG